MNAMIQPVAKFKETVTLGAAFVDFESCALPAAFKLETARMFGNQSLSYSAAVQSDLRHFANQDGFLAYQKKLGHVFVLGDPVIAKDKMPSIIDAFLSRFSNVTFCQVSRLVADILQTRNYWVNEMGIDTLLKLVDYNFSGREMERFRHAHNWLTRRKFQVVESEYDGTTNDEIIQLSQSWKQSRIRKQETAFLNRPLVLSDELDVRRFYLRDGDRRLQAFIFFDPLYDAGQVAGYVTTFKRRLPNAPAISELGISKVAIEKFKQEGLHWVRLGLSPFDNVADENYRYNKVLKQVFKYYFRAGWVNRYIFNVKGQAEFKRRFRGVAEKMYFGSPNWVNEIRLFALMRLSKFL